MALCLGCRATIPELLALLAGAVSASSDVERSPKALPRLLQFPVLQLSAAPHASDASLSGSPSAPTRSSDLLRFWGEDPIEGDDRIAKQFWGDIFAKLLHLGFPDLPPPDFGR